MFHHRAIEGTQDLQAFRIDWKRSTIEIHTHGKTHTTPFAHAIDTAYKMQAELRNAGTFLSHPDLIDSYPRLYLKAFEEYASICMARDSIKPLSNRAWGP